MCSYTMSSLHAMQRAYCWHAEGMQRAHNFQGKTAPILGLLKVLDTDQHGEHSALLQRPDKKNMLNAGGDEPVACRVVVPHHVNALRL